MRELDNVRRFGFSVLSVDLNTAVEDAPVAVDFAPSDFSYWGYALTNRPARAWRCRLLVVSHGVRRRAHSVVPRTAKGKVVRGTISVRVDGKVVASNFAFGVV